LQSLDLDQFVVSGSEAHWDKAEAQLTGATAGGIVSVQRDTPHKSGSASKQPTSVTAKRSKEQQSDRFAGRASSGKKHKRG
jgi:hypothetical protein